MSVLLHERVGPRPSVAEAPDAVSSQPQDYAVLIVERPGGTLESQVITRQRKR